MHEIQQFSKEDFLNSTTPYEFVYQYKGNKFELNQIVEKFSEVAKSVGVKNFKTLFKDYCDLQKTNSNIVYGNYSTNFDGQELELNSGDWQCDDTCISTQGAFGEIVACVHPIMPVLRLVNIDTGIEKLKIAYKKGRGWRSIIADKKTLASASQILELANSGIAVNSENSKYLVRYLHDIENLNYDLIPEKNSVSRLGWIEGEGFSPYVDNLIFDGDSNFKTFFDSVQAKGSFDKWLELAKTIRQSGIVARIILASSFASVLLNKIGGLPFFVHLWGGTEVGKTVGLMLASSVWANPEVGRYIHTFNSTAVGREKAATFVNNLPLILDELQIVKDNKSFDKDIYLLTEGAGKSRGTKTGGVEKVGTWQNCILTSGEMPIVNMSSGGGATNRIIEIECKDKLFINPKEVADTIKKNYGHAGKLFVEYLQDDEVVEKANKIFEDYKLLFEKKDTTEKQIMAISTILTADKLATELIFKDNKELKFDEVAEFLHSKESVSANARAYDYICEYIVSNKNKFSADSEKDEVWGEIDDNYFYIIRANFNRICEDGGFNAQSVLSWLKQSNKIECNDKGTTKSRRIRGIPVNCVYLKRYDPELPF